jgi:hypothetical protein
VTRALIAAGVIDGEPASAGTAVVVGRGALALGDVAPLAAALE